MKDDTKKMTIAEHVFLNLRSTHHHFFWKDWLNEWQKIRPPNPWGSSTMAISGALKQQMKNGTVMRIERGFYVFLEKKPVAPYSLVRKK